MLMIVIFSLQETFGDEEDDTEDDDDVLDLVADEEEELYITLDDYQANDNENDESTNRRSDGADQKKASEIEANMGQIENSEKNGSGMNSERIGIKMKDVKETKSQVRAEKTGQSAGRTPRTSRTVATGENIHS